MPKNLQTTAHTIALNSHANKVMLNILHARLQHYVNQNFQMSKLGLEKAEEPDQIANILWITEKAREFQKNIYLCFIDFTKAFDCVNKNKLWKASFKEMGIPDHLICLLRNLYAPQEATVRTTDWFNMEKGVQEGCLLSSCLFNLYTKHIM